ncbi:MAG: hypothetical protein KOO62_08295 [candidate division Zixibacteria bacterium]|nr:hypothetical protein [candidate division Zixibacteria bacterium]
MKHLVSLILLGVALSVLACDEDTTETGLNGLTTFIVRLDVLDSIGVAVPNLRVSSWNHIAWIENNDNISTSGVSQKSMVPMSTTTISFALPVASDYALGIHDLDNSELNSFNGTGDAGVYEIEWSADGLHSGAYKYTVEASDWSDTKYAYLHKFSILGDSIGYTNASGVFETTHRPYFPNTYDLGPQPRMSEIGELAGTFDILDTVRFVLTDTSTWPLKYMYFDSVVTSGQNVYTVTWIPVELDCVSVSNPGSDAIQRSGDKDVREGMSTENTDQTSEEDELPTEYKLYQNFPNPFN